MNTLIIRQKIAENVKIANRFTQLGKLLYELEARQLPEETTNFINQEIEQLNAISDTDKSFV